ncbi:MAG: hypothetical protein GY742_14505 [Hyphomicrobiales bacterium]|nr:hypothetical protein [Hyphomicrobiales bacterium]
MNINDEYSAASTRPLWKRKRLWFAGFAGIVAILLICIHTIPRFPFGPYTLYANLTEEQRNAKIPYKMLSNETTHPFFTGKAPKYVVEIERYRDVRDCLVSSERSKPEPDLRLIDWNKLWNYEEAEVCLWRILSSLGTKERATLWFSFHNLSNPRNVKKYGLQMPTRGFGYVIGSFVTFSQTFRAAWGKNGELLAVGAGHTTL